MSENFVELIKSQQDNGLELLQKEYSGLLHYVVGGILTNQEDIEECISDIYLKVWKSIDSFSTEKGKFSTWITTISRNTALNYSYRQRTTHSELREDTPDPFSLEREVLRREQAAELKQIVNTLTSEEKQIFYRKYYYLQKIAQIARELGTSERSIEGKLYRLRKKIQKKLGGDFE